MITIQLNRDSVCIGDDVEDHRISMDVSDAMTFDELFSFVIKNKFLPQVNGNAVVWVLTYEDSDLISYVTKSNKMYSCFIDCSPTVISRVEASNPIIFKYYSSQLKRAECLFRKFDGKKFHIWHEGYMNEYESYKVSQQQEEIWIKDINKGQ